MRDYSAPASQEGSCVVCCQVCVFFFTAVLIVAERTSLIYCFVYYLWVGHNYCYAHLAGFTALFLLPGWGPQWLSYLWYLSDGRIRRKSLTWTHILHLGIFKRLWECMRLPDMDVYGEIMQQADVAALRLLEALVVTLPQTLLHTYVLICTDIGIKSPASVCFAVCLLSLAWALVLYARSCTLIRPGHLHMTPAAIFCQLLWRVSMLGSRFGVLMLFTRIFKQWILGVIGVHWLGATFWMVSQQTDIIRSTSRWRLFNLILGAIHIFFFLNVKYGPSRLRMAGFYLVMFLENIILLLASSWLFSMVSWDTVAIPGAVVCSFLIGVISLVLYYRFLHPKSFEIFQSIRRRGLSGACMESSSILSLEEKVTPTFQRHATLSGGGTLMDLSPQWEGWRHHHWLLIRLALKTGDVPKIWSLYGEGGLAGLMGLCEELHYGNQARRVPQTPRISPQTPQALQPTPQPLPPQEREVAPPPKPAPTNVIARPVRKAPPSTIHDIRLVPEIIPVHEAILEEITENFSAPQTEDKGDEDYHSAIYGSPTLSSPAQPESLRNIDSYATSLTEKSSSAASLDIKTPAWSPERRSPLLLGSPEKKSSTPLEPNTSLYFSVDAPSPSSGSYLGWGSELSPISTYRSPYRIREARFVPSTPRPESRAGAESPSLAPVVIIPATPGTTPRATPGGTPGSITPAASTPTASTPGAVTPASATTPSTPIAPLTPVISHARKQMVQLVDSRERAV
ncbi:XK-related protein 5b isoform X2 [Stigmatopora argus]